MADMSRKKTGRGWRNGQRTCVGPGTPRTSTQTKTMEGVDMHDAENTGGRSRGGMRVTMYALWGQGDDGVPGGMRPGWRHPGQDAGQASRVWVMNNMDVECCYNILEDLETDRKKLETGIFFFF